jgi:hypothetical protein
MKVLACWQEEMHAQAQIILLLHLLHLLHLLTLLNLLHQLGICVVAVSMWRMNQRSVHAWMHKLALLVPRQKVLCLGSILQCKLA